jgi:putative ABC transport system ATP-binding protein
MSRIRSRPGDGSPAAAPPLREPGSTVLELDGLSMVYGDGAARVRALDDVSLRLRGGSFSAIMGPSGSGKSTLLNCAAGLEQPTQGRILIAGQEMPWHSERALTRFRRGRVELIFQQYNLLPALTVQENVTLPGRLAGRAINAPDVDRVLDLVGLAERRDARPAELSGGQQQRTAIARALLAAPDLLLADEPTGALDRRTAAGVLDLLRQAVTLAGQTVVMVTHDPVAAAVADQVLFLADGRLAGRLDHPTVEQLAEHLAGAP